MISVEPPTDADIDVLHPMLRETYWSPGIPRDTVERACANSLCAIARSEAGVLIGFARAVTDRTVFAWVCDVIVAPEHRGDGLALVLEPDLRTKSRRCFAQLRGVGDLAGFASEFAAAANRGIRLHELQASGPRVFAEAQLGEVVDAIHLQAEARVAVRDEVLDVRERARRNIECSVGLQAQPPDLATEVRRSRDHGCRLRVVEELHGLDRLAAADQRARVGQQVLWLANREERVTGREGDGQDHERQEE